MTSVLDQKLEDLKPEDKFDYSTLEQYKVSPDMAKKLAAAFQIYMQYPDPAMELWLQITPLQAVLFQRDYPEADVVHFAWSYNFGWDLDAAYRYCTSAKERQIMIDHPMVSEVNDTLADYEIKLEDICRTFFQIAS